MRKKNPWIQKRKKGLGNFEFSSAIGMLLMGYGVYCFLNWASDVVRGFGTPRHG